MNRKRQLCTFRVADSLYGVDVVEVQEVLRAVPMTAVPLAHEVVRGLINLRGRIVAALDLRRRLGLPPAGADARHVNVVLETSDGPVSLLVDEIVDVLEVDEACFEPPPETLVGPVRELITGAFKLDERLLLVLDTKATLALATPS